jgi:hypothetical protein
MNAVPPELQGEGGHACWKFAQTVAQAATSMKSRSLEPPWEEIFEKLRDSKDFQKAVDSLRIEKIEQFVRQGLRLFRDNERISAEIQREFAKAVKARLIAGKPIGSTEIKPREIDDLQDLPRQARKIYHYMENKKRAEVQDFVEQVWGLDEAISDTALGQRFTGTIQYPAFLSN